MRCQKWYHFKNFQPAPDTHIMIEDHEGNHVCGVWTDEFIAAMGVPHGHLVKWCEIKLTILDGDFVTNKRYLLAHYLNGEQICLQSLYDPSVPCRFSDVT